MLPELASNSQSLCFGILNDEILGLYYHCPLHSFFQKHLSQLNVAPLFRRKGRRNLRSLFVILFVFIETRSPSVGLDGLELSM